MNYVLAYDIGTTGIKTCLYLIQDNIHLVASELKGYELNVLKNGGVEQDPDTWYQAMCETTKKVISKTQLEPAMIKGISFCAQMQGLVLIDINGNPVRPAMSYMDNRASKEKEMGLEHGLKISGMNIKKLLTALKITGAVPASIKDPVWKYKWVERHEPDVFSKVYKWLDIKEYLISRLTGQTVMTEDSAFATLLYDVKEKQFSKKICDLFGVNYDHMPRIVKGTDIVGHLSSRVARELGLAENTPVFGGGGDAALVGVGAGAVSLHESHIYMGTSGWVSTVVDKKIVDISSMIASIQGASDRYLNYFAELETAGKCMEWVRDHLALDEIDIYLKKVKVTEDEAVSESLYDYMMSVIKDVPAGSHGVMFTPWLHGNRCPFEDHHARGIFFNIGLDTGKRDMIHAVLEGVCYHLKWQLEASEKRTKTLPTLRFVGGGALSELTCQLLSNVLNRPIETVYNPQNIGSVGAAVLIGVGLGWIKDLEDAKHFIQVKERYEPDKKAAEIYDNNFPVFKSLYLNNKKSFYKLNA
ncbi:carbohydrate kinase [Acidaminobacter sp. JC074]|uniref:xylulokinase n=1 Tax=Acidaminobacter sp. JC074 TaxID=2530199 RepID=UPI001F0DC7BD|nr:FGGY-family carbohydrate kinase [Acidaminobacter sp. JC074]MCH4888114.1 carbohydrate kinase [Acidaminobacter sp. JC074]